MRNATRPPAYPATAPHEIRGTLFTGDGWAADYDVVPLGAGPGLPAGTGVEVHDAWITSAADFADSYGAEQFALFDTYWAAEAIEESL